MHINGMNLTALQGDTLSCHKRKNTDTDNWIKWKQIFWVSELSL